MAPLAGHGHADALALWLALDGHPVLGSRGTSAYHQPRVRERERGSTSHSTVMVGGRSSSVPHDHPFLWHTQAAAVLEHVRLQGHGGEVAAHHRGWPTVTPHRHVQLDPGQLRVSDHLRGAGRGLVTRRWHLAPGWTATVDRRVVRLRGPGPEVELQPAGPVRLEPWPHAVGYGEQVPAVTIVEEQPHRFPVDLVSTFRWSTERRGGHLAHQQACPSHGA